MRIYVGFCEWDFGEGDCNAYLHPRQLVDLPDVGATRVVISHYRDAKDVLIKALG